MATRYKATANVAIRSGPSKNYAVIGTVSEGSTIRVTETIGAWFHHSDGWSDKSYFEKVTSSRPVLRAPATSDTDTDTTTTTVTTTTENSTSTDTSDGTAASDEVVDTDEEGSGYQVDVDTILTSYEDTSAADFININHIAGVFGLPYQFLPNTDPRLSSTGNDNIILGYEYADRIVTRIPLLMMAPGKASFMTKFSTKDKESIISKMVDAATGVDESTISDLIDEDGRYYTFEYQSAEYYQFVNPMCRAAAIYLDIGDETLDGQTLANISWEDFTQSRINGLADFGTYTSVPFYMDSETSVSESFSNSTTESMIASTVNSISDYGRELSFLLGYGSAATGIDTLITDADIASNIENVQDTISSLLGSGNFLSNLSKHLTTVAAGGKLIFPEIWSDSIFSRSYSCEFKFISPDPSNLSVYLNVLVPLFHLLAFVAPQSVASNPNGYTNPFLVRAIYKGFFNVDMGIITDMSVTKGAECQWTPEGIPTSINVSIDIKDLYSSMSITPTTAGLSYDTMNNTALMDYIANLCGINIYKPEIARQIEMWTALNITGRVTDVLNLGIWGKMQEKVQNAIMNIYR